MWIGKVTQENNAIQQDLHTGRQTRHRCNMVGSSGNGGNRTKSSWSHADSSNLNNLEKRHKIKPKKAQNQNHIQN